VHDYSQAGSQQELFSQGYKVQFKQLKGVESFRNSLDSHLPFQISVGLAQIPQQNETRIVLFTSLTSCILEREAATKGSVAAEQLFKLMFLIEKRKLKINECLVYLKWSLARAKQQSPLAHHLTFLI